MEPAPSWRGRSDEACVAELLERTRVWSTFRADRLRLPIKAVDGICDGDRVQCFHDAKTGFHDWAQISLSGRAAPHHEDAAAPGALWTARLTQWRERAGAAAPPAVATIGDLLDLYAELRINNAAAAASRAAAAPPGTRLFHLLRRSRAADDAEASAARHQQQQVPRFVERWLAPRDDAAASWLDQPNAECYEELARRCRANAAWRPWRLRRDRGAALGPDGYPEPGDRLQLFRDKVTGFATFGELRFDVASQVHVVRVFAADSGGDTRCQRGDDDAHGQHHGNSTAAPDFVDIPLAAVLEQHAEIRVFSAPTGAED